ncbi:MAG: hypothetical protein QM715_15455 [Nibricoccus sp.]
MSSFSPLLAEAGQSLFDNEWVAFFVILGSLTAFVHAIIAFRRSLATAPQPAKTATASAGVATPAPAEGPSVEVFAAIAAAVAVTLGSKARIASVKPSTVVVDPGHLQWSAEGRRQIYSSHKVR